MNSFDIRQKFFDFFKEKQHTIVPSSSLIPAEDPTLLFTNAGMNQFKDLFLGNEKRSYTRAVSIQKCIRAGGKHNDLDNVGFTKRHLTFFEMMGNFSFGDYFKHKAIEFAWEFLTKKINLAPEILYVSVFCDDQESYDIWLNTIKIPEKRIVKLGEKDNFWQMGDTGPCGPCTEIYIDRGAHYNCPESNCAPGCSCERFLEIWNLVFMQYDRQPDGTLQPLTHKGVDTGMGLERLCSVLEKKDSVFETDLFAPLIKKIEELTNIDYNTTNPEQQAAFRVLADHIRSSSFAIADGVIPAADGRGYVLRKIIRRAALFSQKLTDKNIFPQIASTLINYMGSIYPEIIVQEKLILKILNDEIDKFSLNLVQGQKILQEYFTKNKSNSITGYQAFKLYDTYGFPLELTQLIAQEKNFIVDAKAFDEEMEKQRIQSGKKKKDDTLAYALNSSLKTDFTGYDELETNTTITALLVNGAPVQSVAKNTNVWIITEKSPFYVECGGQVNDQGFIQINDTQVPILDLKKINNAIAFNINAPQDLSINDTMKLIVDKETRANTMKNHTATHLLQAALITVLGNSVKQAGSVVTPDYLRFDFTYHENLNSSQIKAVEDLINSKIQENILLSTKKTTLQQAQKDGVIAFFGEKYNPDNVRVVAIPEFSAELCGGTHVKRTGDIGLFKITEVAALSAGNRRIVAVTGPAAINLFQESFNTTKALSQEFKVTQNDVLQAVNRQKDTLKESQYEIKKLKSELYKTSISEWIKNIQEINKIPFLYLSFKNLSVQDLKEIAENLNHHKAGLYFLISTDNNNKATFLVMQSRKLDASINMKEFAQHLKEHGLRGGAQEYMIQGGGANLKNSLEENIKEWLTKYKR